VSEYPFYNNVYPFVASSFALAALAMTILLTATTKMNFLTAVFFNTLWLIASYVPLTHWMKPFSSAGRPTGWMSQNGFGTLDSTSAHAVHMNAGVAFLVLSFWMGELRTRTVVVADYDNFFWLKFGFSGYIVAGSMAGLASMYPAGATGATSTAFPWSLGTAASFIPVEAGPKLINVILASGAGLLTMVAIDVIFNHGQGLFRGRPSASSALTGFLAGLISVTAGAGHISPNWASFFGFFTTLVVYVSPFVLGLVGIDQGYSPFVLHFIGAAVSSALTGLFANPNYSGAIYSTGTPNVPDVAHYSGSFYNNSVQLGKQCAAISVTVLLSAVATTAVYWTVYAVERLCIFPHIKTLKEGDEGEENLVALKF
jgi:Amt family ammonium transporter